MWVIHMKCQALFYQKNTKKFKMSSAEVVFNTYFNPFVPGVP